MITSSSKAMKRRTLLEEGEGGFTLIELMVVVAIIGILIGIGIVGYGGVTEQQRLHTTVRQFVGIYRETRAYAAKERRHCVLEFNMEESAWRRIIYPRTDTAGNFIDANGEILDFDATQERLERTAWKFLPRGVVIENIEGPAEDGNEQYAIDYYCTFRTDGTIPPHIIHFATSKGLLMSLEIEELTGATTVREGHTEFYAPQEHEFDSLGGGELGGR